MKNLKVLQYLLQNFQVLQKVLQKVLQFFLSIVKSIAKIITKLKSITKSIAKFRVAEKNSAVAFFTEFWLVIIVFTLYI